MAFFVRIVIDDLARVAAVGAVFFLLTVVGVCGIDPNGQCKVFLSITIPFILAIVLLLLLLSLLRGLSAIRAPRSWSLQFLRSGLRFFNP